MLIAMSGNYERRDELAGMSPAEFALIKASMSQARARVEGLLKRVGKLTGTVDSRYRQVPQGDPASRRGGGVRHGSC